MKKLTFFPNGQNVNQIKNQAKYLHKKGEFKSRSEALNSISKSICGMSFNKAVNNFEELSIFEFNELFYIPLENNKIKYYAQISKKDNRLYFTETLYIELSNNLKFYDLEYSHFEKIENGYIVNLDSNNKEEYYIEIKKTDEGIVADLLCNEEMLDSTYVFYSELMEVNELMNMIEWDNKEDLSDFNLSVQLNHKKPDQVTELFTIHEKYQFNLVGCTTIITPEGNFVYGESILHLVEDGICTNKELYDFLEKNKDIKSLKDYEVNSNPYISIIDLDSEGENEELTDHIKKDLYLNLEY
tara:strand:+ start:39472 stop:40368 length:897 start_codon:yes stop_codon:yes gene_type:complete